MNTLLTLLAALWAGGAWGAELRLLELREFSFESYSIADHRDAYFNYADPDSTDQERWLGGVATNFNLDLVRSGTTGLYLRNRVHGEGTDSQVRQVGWQYELGVSYKKMELYWSHHSQHVLDAARDTKYPLDNFYGARIIFYRRDK